MTKYILNSGAVARYPEKNKKFILESFKTAPSNPKVLMVFFAQPRELWEAKYPKFTTAISDILGDKYSPTYTLSMPDEFESQVELADVVMIFGGDDELLQHRLEGKDLRGLFKNKIVSVNSAGSNVLSTCYWTCDWREVQKGFGVLPIKFLSHYKSDFGDDDTMRGPIDWVQAYDDLKCYGDKSMKIYALEEADFVVIDA